MEIKKAEATLKPNYMLIPTTVLDMTEDGANIFNEHLKRVRDLGYNLYTKTNSGGISIKKFRLPCYNINISTSCVELVVLESKGFYRLQFRSKLKKDDGEINKLSGRKAFTEFKKILKNYNIDLDEYAIDNGIDVKKDIPSPLIKIERNSYIGLTMENVHHIDFHNSYPAGLVNTHPEFKEVITYLYNKRKENSDYKAILNFSIGFMQSVRGCGAKFAHLAKDAIEDNNKRILDMANRLRENGNIILSYNTDGIWYKGNIYHGENEGKSLGQWENDHVNCKWRAKSAGAYEFIENGKYYPVVRGYTNLDKIKSRDKWQWGDIFKAVINKFYIDDENYIRFYEDEE